MGESYTALDVASHRTGCLSELRAALDRQAADPSPEVRTAICDFLAQNAWILEEGFFLSGCDEALGQRLNEYAHLLGLGDRLLFMQIPSPDPDRAEHLIVDVKDSSVGLDESALDHVGRYAFAVSTDARFSAPQVHWSFWVLAHQMDELVQRRLSDHGEQPRGLVCDTERVMVWVKTWDQVLAECQVRLEFVLKRGKPASTAGSAASFRHHGAVSLGFR